MTLKPDRLPPYSEEAERGVLGAIMLDYRAVEVAVEYKLKEEAFYVPAHRTVFKAVLHLFEQKCMVDVLTIGERLTSTGDIEQLGGLVFLDRLVDGTPTAAHVVYYAQIVSEKWRLRSIIEDCRETEKQCYEPDEDSAKIITTHASALMQIEAQHEQEEITWDETVQKSMKSIHNIMESGDKLAGFSTGFDNIDRSVLGLKKKELTIIAARPGMGKTSLAMNIAEYVASGKNDLQDQERPVGIFSLEMGAEQLALRMKCSHAGIDNWKLMRGFIPQSDVTKLVNTAQVLSKLPLYVDDRAALDIDQISIKARRWKQKYDIQLVVVDYLQLVHCMKKAKQGRQLEVSAISAQLKQMSMELAIPVIALSQLSRKPEERKGCNGKPMLSDLRESGSIEQDADNVWFIRRPSKYKDDPEHEDTQLAILDIAKQRNGPTGEARLNFTQEFTRFDDRVKSIEDDTDPL